MAKISGSNPDRPTSFLRKDVGQANEIFELALPSRSFSNWLVRACGPNRWLIGQRLISEYNEELLLWPMARDSALKIFYSFLNHH